MFLFTENKRKRGFAGTRTRSAQNQYFRVIPNYIFFRDLAVFRQERSEIRALKFVFALALHLVCKYPQCAHSVQNIYQLIATLKQPQFLRGTKLLWVYDSISLIFARNLPNIATKLHNPPFLFRISSMITNFFYENERLFLIENDLMSPLFAINLPNLARGHLFLINL